MILLEWLWRMSMKIFDYEKKALLVSIEGPDGIGKSTQVKLVADSLRKTGSSVITAKLPAYHTFTGRLIRRMLNDGRALSYPNIFQLIQWLDKIVFQILVLRTYIKHYDYVILDRWHASMWVYGLSTGSNESLTNALTNMVREPDVVVLLCGDYKRINDDKDSYEKSAALQKKVSLYYALWACINKNDTHVVDGNEKVEIVTQNIVNAIQSTR